MINIALLEAIKTVGFPIVVCLWLMFRTDKKIERMANLFEAYMRAPKKGE